MNLMAMPKEISSVGGLQTQTFALTHEQWRHNLAHAVEALFEAKSLGSQLVVPKKDYSQFPAFMYAGEQSKIWIEMTSAAHNLTTRRQSREELLIEEDVADFVRMKIRPKTILEFGSGASEAIVNKTGLAVSAFHPENFISLEMSPDFVRLPAFILSDNTEYPSIRSISSFQRDHNLPLPVSEIAAAVPSVSDGSIFMMSLGSGFCNLCSIPENGFPSEEYEAQFRNYAEIGALNPGRDVYLYISYFKGDEDQNRDQYENFSTTRWFARAPYMIGSMLNPTPSQNGQVLRPHDFTFDLFKDPERYLLAGTLKATVDQGFRIKNGGPIECTLPRDGRLVLNTHYSPPTKLWAKIARAAGWEVEQMNTHGPFNRILFRLDRG